MPKIPDVKIGITVGVGEFKRDWKQVIAIIQDAERVRVKAAKDAAKEVDRSRKDETRATERAAKEQKAVAEKKSKDEKRLSDQARVEAERSEKAKSAAAVRAAKEKIAAYKKADEYERQARKAAEREVSESERKKASEARKWLAERKRQEEEIGRHQFAIREKYARTIGYGFRSGTQAIHRIGTQALNAMGGFTFADTIRNRGAEEGLATNIALQGSKKGGKKFNGAEVLTAATAVGVESGMGTHSALEALDVFTKKSGDLQTGLDILKDLATYADASGTEFKDLAGAAAELFSSETVKNGNELNNILGSILEMGKDGAVELSDLAVGFGRITASAGQFAGDKQENVKKLTAFAEMSKKYAAASPREALTSISNLASDIAKKSGKFQGIGVNVFDKTGKFMRDPLEILHEAMKNSGGLSPKQQHDLFGERSFRSIAGAAEIYNKARQGGATDEGAWAEVMKRFNELLDGMTTHSEAVKQASERRAAKDREAAKAMEDLKAKVGDALLPVIPKLADSIVKLIPAMTRLADGIVTAANIMSEHPWVGLGAIVAGYIGAEIAKAKIAEIISALIVGKAPGTAGAFTGTAGAKAAAGGGVMATGGAMALAVMSVSGAVKTGSSVIDGMNTALDIQNGSDALFQKLIKGTATPDDVAAAQKKLGQMRDLQERTKDVDVNSRFKGDINYALGMGSVVEGGIDSAAGLVGLKVPEYLRGKVKNRTEADIAQQSNLPQAIDNLAKALDRNTQATHSNTDGTGSVNTIPPVNREHFRGSSNQ